MSRLAGRCQWWADGSCIKYFLFLGYGELVRGE